MTLAMTICEVPIVEWIGVTLDSPAAHAFPEPTAVGVSKHKCFVSSTHIDDSSVQHPCSSAWDASIAVSSSNNVVPHTDNTDNKLIVITLITLKQLIVITLISLIILTTLLLL